MPPFSANTKITSLKYKNKYKLKKYKCPGKPRELPEGFFGLTLLLLILLKESIICVPEKAPSKEPDGLLSKYQMSCYWKTSIKDY